MDLDPKGANNQIKEAIDKRYVTDEEDTAAGKNMLYTGLCRLKTASMVHQVWMVYH